eukprot:scaffold70142_cov57-Phaeocystis_antarctica.AAC.1
MAAAASGRQLGRPFLEGGNIRVRSRSNTLSAQHAASSVLIASSGNATAQAPLTANPDKTTQATSTVALEPSSTLGHRLTVAEESVHKQPTAATIPSKGPTRPSTVVTHALGVSAYA